MSKSWVFACACMSVFACICPFYRCHFRVFIRIHYETSTKCAHTKIILQPDRKKRWRASIVAIKCRTVPLSAVSLTLSSLFIHIVRVLSGWVFEFSFITYTHVETVSTMLYMESHWNRHICIQYTR